MNMLEDDSGVGEPERHGRKSDLQETFRFILTG